MLCCLRPPDASPIQPRSAHSWTRRSEMTAPNIRIPIIRSACSERSGAASIRMAIPASRPARRSSKSRVAGSMKTRLPNAASPERLRSIVNDFWPQVEVRLVRLDTPALVTLVDVADQWVRLARGFEGAFGVKPPPEASSIAGPFSGVIIDALAKTGRGKPAAQIAL